MKYTLISYYDKDLKKFFPPIVIPMNLEDTVESLKDSTIKGQIPDAKNKDAYCVGFFDTATGKFIVDESSPEKVLELSQYVRE